ncbi:MAG: 2-amino-4-hydroxy-6-hydroxymethyldihydropteridine diphosphokinase [Desulfobacterales bacterium]|nr:2-amino-4-hydroxy-6-hydroxymethyldihydropteridine diphosphokinase [Desulfobacterales bacterium]
MTVPGKNTYTAYIAVGANLGDRIAGCREGILRLAESGDIEIVHHSPYYYTEPVDYADQPWFVNAVCRVHTCLDPRSLLGRLKTVEATTGRSFGGVRFGPRVLDLDLIFYDQAVIQTRDLVVPHPRMHQRAFVLRPLHDIAADFVHPVFRTRISEMLSDPEVAGQACYRVADEAFCKTAAGRTAAGCEEIGNSLYK